MLNQTIIEKNKRQHYKLHYNEIILLENSLLSKLIPVKSYQASSLLTQLNILEINTHVEPDND